MQEFAANGATIHILARDLSKADAVVGEIVASTGNQDITIHKVDLNDFSTIRAFAEKFLTTKSPIHILINNAGLSKIRVSGQSVPDSICFSVNQRKKLSSDGIEQTVQTNHLSHFLLTNLLLDRMIQSAPSRIINVSSMGHLYVKPKDFDVYDVKLENLPASHYNYGHMAYIASKLMNVLFTRELARRLYGTSESCTESLDHEPRSFFSDVTVNSVHPGAVRTEILRDVHWTHPITILIMMSIPFQKARLLIQHLIFLSSYCLLVSESDSRRCYDSVPGRVRRCRAR